MTLAPIRRMSMSEFLAWEERQEARFEFDGVGPVAMDDVTVAHEEIGGSLRALLYARLRGTPCHVRGPTLKVEVSGHIRYPDAFVACTRSPHDATVIRDPVVVFEVLSQTTSRTDRIEKLCDYQATPSIRRYVILEQDSIAATVFARHDGDWIAHALTGGDTLAMPEIGVDLPLAEIYADVELPEPPAEEASA